MAHPRVYRRHIRCPACGSNWMPRHGSSKGRQVERCGDCQRYHTPDAAYTRPSTADQERSLALYQEGVALSAIARRFGVTPPAVSRRVKKGGRAALSRLRRRGQQRTADPAGRPPAAVIAYDEMWTYQQARRGAQRQDLRIWTAVIEGTDGCRWADFAVGDRNENTFQQLYARLPEADLYRSDAYGVYQSWLPPGRHVVHLLNGAEGL